MAAWAYIAGDCVPSPGECSCAATLLADEFSLLQCGVGGAAAHDVHLHRAGGIRRGGAAGEPRAGAFSEQIDGGGGGRVHGCAARGCSGGSEDSQYRESSGRSSGADAEVAGVGAVDRWVLFGADWGSVARDVAAGDGREDGAGIDADRGGARGGCAMEGR